MISSIKLFYLDGTAMVAVYGGDHEGADDWLCNLPANEVLNSDPSVLPAEESVPIAAARQLVTFTAGFRRRVNPEAPPMQAAQLVEMISATTDIPAPEVRKIVRSLLQQLAGLVETGGRLETPLLRIRPNGPAGRAKQPVSLLVPKRPKPQEA